MSFELTIPRNGAAPFRHTITTGESMFLLGANGTGKSSLMHHLYRANAAKARRITAHRQTWFESNSIAFSPQQRQAAETEADWFDSRLASRWSDGHGYPRVNMAIYDLFDAENTIGREMLRALRTNNSTRINELRNKASPINAINELLRISNIPITISIQENGDVVANKNSGPPFSIAELSDGERNAILIAANVLTAKPDTLLLIDEPERHLHRSIISPLISSLIANRPDCAFIVSTHEVMLPLDNRNARTLLIRGCAYNGSSVTGWDVDLVSAASEIDDDLKRDILGARRKILFVEGTQQSLDKPLYSLIFPDVSVIAKGNCRDVQHAVRSIRDTDQLVWLEAFGLIDNDQRPATEVEELEDHGVYALSVYSVESVYYHPEIQRRVAERHAGTTGDDPEAGIAAARAAALKAICPHIQRLAERAAERRVREAYFAKIPGKEQISAAQQVYVSIDVPTIVQEQDRRLRDAHAAHDLETIIAHYPVRDTPALDEIARKLGFTGRQQYAGAVRKLLMDDADALAFARSLFGTLPDDLAASDGSATSPVKMTSEAREAGPSTRPLSPVIEVGPG